MQIIRNDKTEEITPTLRVIQLGEEKFISWASLTELRDLVGDTDEAKQELEDWIAGEALGLIEQALLHLPAVVVSEAAGFKEVPVTAALDTVIRVTFTCRPMPAGWNEQVGVEVAF